jgi:hypothetical protein
MPSVSDGPPRGADVTPQAISRPRCEEQDPKKNRPRTPCHRTTNGFSAGQLRRLHSLRCGSTVFAAAPQSSNSSLRCATTTSLIGRVATQDHWCARGDGSATAVYPRFGRDRLRTYNGSTTTPASMGLNVLNIHHAIRPQACRLSVLMRCFQFALPFGKSKLHGCYRSAPLSSSLAPDRARLPAFPTSLLVTCRLRRLR